MTYKQLLIPLCIFILAFYLRFDWASHSFWVDEFSTASQARVVLKYGFNPFFQRIDYFEAHNVTTHFIVAALFHFFGESEFIARFPSMIFGALVPVMLYVVGRQLFSAQVGFAAATLATFSYWLTTWSQQARGYALQQLLVLATLFVYFSAQQKGFSTTKVILLLVLATLGMLTHLSFVFLLGALVLHGLFFHGRLQIKSLFSMQVIAIIAFLLCVAFLSGQVQAVSVFIAATVRDFSNNVGYYHSFLWREHTLVSFLAFLGVILAFQAKKTQDAVIALVLVVALYLFFFFFLFSPYVSRYLLPIFPILLLFAGVALAEFAKLISRQHHSLVLVGLVLFMIANGDTFSMQKRQFYSVNRDMREIALLDYHSVYAIVRERFIDGDTTALIDTWPDRMRWYMGHENTTHNKYVFRWDNLPGKSNGLTRSTPYTEVAEEKILPLTGDPALKLITSQSDLERIMSIFPTGFLFIDDSSLSAEVIAYAEENLYRELYLDHYPFDENPYSIWPATLYSWGFESENPFYSHSPANNIE